MAKTVYICVKPFATTVAGVRRVFGAGKLILEDDPIRPATRGNFEEISEYVERTNRRPHRRGQVEQATAAPGEKRRVGRPRGSKNKPKIVAEADQHVASQATEKEESDGEA